MTGRELTREEDERTAPMDWATHEIKNGALESPLARNEDGSPMTLRQLLDKAKRKS